MVNLLKQNLKKKNDFVCLKIASILGNISQTKICLLALCSFKLI